MLCCWVIRGDVAVLLQCFSFLCFNFPVKAERQKYLQTPASTDPEQENAFSSAFQRPDPAGAHPWTHPWGQEVGDTGWLSCSHMPHSPPVGGGSSPPQSHWRVPMEIRALGAGWDAEKHQMFATNEHQMFATNERTGDNPQNEWWAGKLIVFPAV